MYDDQATQDYVNIVGQRVALASDMPQEEFKFTVIDDESINAFTTGCCNVYVNRGLLVYLNSEAELAGVLGHEIGHVTARHPARRQTRGMAASLGAMAAAILTGSNADRPARQHRRPGAGCRVMVARTKWKRIASASNTW